MEMKEASYLRDHHHHHQRALKSLLALLLETNKDPHHKEGSRRILVLPTPDTHMDPPTLDSLTEGLPLHLLETNRDHPHLPKGAEHEDPPKAKHPSNLHVHDRCASNLLNIEDLNFYSSHNRVKINT
jgi:hypothetical protein